MDSDRHRTRVARTGGHALPHPPVGPADAVAVRRASRDRLRLRMVQEAAPARQGPPHSQRRLTLTKAWIIRDIPHQKGFIGPSGFVYRERGAIAFSDAPSAEKIIADLIHLRITDFMTPGSGKRLEARETDRREKVESWALVIVPYQPEYTGPTRFYGGRDEVGAADAVRLASHDDAKSLKELLYSLRRIAPHRSLEVRRIAKRRHPPTTLAARGERKEAQ